MPTPASIRNSWAYADDVSWLSRFAKHNLTKDEQVAMIVAREMGAINNSTFRLISGCETLVASGHLRRLRDLNLLVQRGKGNKTYYELEESANIKSGEIAAKSGGLGAKSGGLSTKSGGLAGKAGSLKREDLSDSAESETAVDLPPEVVERLPKIAGKSTRHAMRRAILELCCWRPLMPSEIAHFLNRKSIKRLVEDYISPMNAEGVLERTIPLVPAHPAQKYRTTSKGSSETLVPLK